MKRFICFAVLAVACLFVDVSSAKAQGNQECWEECAAYGGRLAFSIQIHQWQVGCGSGIFCTFGASGSFECHEFASAIGEDAQCFYATNPGYVKNEPIDSKKKSKSAAVKKPSPPATDPSVCFTHKKQAS